MKYDAFVYYFIKNYQEIKTNINPRKEFLRYHLLGFDIVVLDDYSVSVHVDETIVDIFIGLPP